MLRLFRRERPRQVCSLIALLTGLTSGLARAETVNYGADPMLAITTVNLGANGSRPVSLAEIFAMIESDTGMKISHPPGEIPLGTEVVIETEGAISLARLFTAVSAKHDIVFEHRNGQITMRANRREPAAAAVADARPANFRIDVVEGSHGDPSDFATALAAEVSAIAGNSRLSAAKKEKQISAAVRAAIASASSHLESDVEILATTVELAGAAAGAAPRFTEVIASAASFAPPIAGIKTGAAQVRTAAYAGARGPRRRSSSAPRTAHFDTREAAVKHPVSAGRISADPFTTGKSIPEAAVAAPAAQASSDSFVPRLSASSIVPNEPAPSPAANPGMTTNADGVVRMDKLNVQGVAAPGSAADLRSQRENAAVALDFLSAAQLAKYGASDLAEVIIRIPGVSVAGGQFAVIRGLSDRYTNTTINGLKIPSPDPEKQSPQLDILPTTLIDSVVVSKSFAPYLWADTSGGSIDLRNAEVDAEDRTISLSYGVKLNENARDGGARYDVPDRKNDWLAQGSKSRPGSSPEEFRKSWDFIPQHDSLPLGQKFSINYNDGVTIAARAVGFNLSAAYDVGSTQRSGEKKALLAGFRGDASRPVVENSEYRSGTPRFLDGGNWNYEQSKLEVTVTGLAGIGVKLSENHKLRAMGFWTRTAADTVQTHTSPLTTYSYATPSGSIVKTLVGIDQGEESLGDYSNFVPQALERHRDVQVYTERKLEVFQLAGGHEFPTVGDLKLDWVAQQASTYQDEPNLVDARYYRQLDINPPGTDFSWGIPVGQYGLSPSGTAAINRFWGATEETQSTYRLDAEWPLTKFAARNTRFRFGGASEDTQREFQGSNHTGLFHSLGLAQRTGSDPDKFFNSIVATEVAKTNRTEQVRNITAAYASLSINLPGKVELIAGARFERFEISTQGKDAVNGVPTGNLYHYVAPVTFGTEFLPSFDRFAPVAVAHVTKVSFSERGWYPSLGLIFRPTPSITFRVTGSKTSGRPSLREMGPYYNRSLESGEYVVGNPFLQTSEVTSLDTRLEWTRNRTSRFAVSVFAKQIETPIEKIFLPGALNGEGVETWSNNANAAELLGTELEFSQRLGWGFTLGGNFTWIKAEVEEHPEVMVGLRTRLHVAPDETISRTLYDQPDYIANLDLTWSQPRWGTSISVAGYAISDVLESVGGGARNRRVGIIPDVTLNTYDRAYHRVDFTASQVLFGKLRLKFSIGNLTDPVLGTIYDPTRTPDELIRNAYHAGRNYSLTLSQTF